MTAKVASIVLTYNNFADTDECLASLAALDYPAHDIVVVDNGSSDGSLPRLRDRWQDRVRFIETGANLGAAAGWNTGVRAAFADNDYFLILNNDIAVEPDLVQGLLRAFEGAPHTALASPVIVSYERPEITWFAGGRYNSLFGLSRHAGLGRRWQRLGKGFGGLVATDYAPLCAAMVSKAAFERVGLFDESFFFGHEDVDWCLRARDAGFQCRVVGRPLVRHKVSASSGVRGSLTFTPFSAFHFAAGSVKLGRKRNRGWRFLPFAAGQILVRLPLYALRMARAGQGQAIVSYFKGLKEGLSAEMRPLPASPVKLSPTEG